jgi:long-chain acyl-CoA synthetase
MGSRTGKQQVSPYAGKPWLKHYDYWVPEQTNFPRQPLSHMLNLAAAQFNDHPATVFLDALLTFGQLKERADKLATALALLGIRKVDRVGIMLPNCPQYLVSFFAIVRLGAIVTNVNPIYTPREVELVAKDSGMRNS